MEYDRDVLPSKDRGCQKGVWKVHGSLGMHPASSCCKPWCDWIFKILWVISFLTWLFPLGTLPHHPSDGRSSAGSGITHVTPRISTPLGRRGSGTETTQGREGWTAKSPPQLSTLIWERVSYLLLRKARCIISVKRNISTVLIPVCPYLTCCLSTRFPLKIGQTCMVLSQDLTSFCNDTGPGFKNKVG